MERELAELRRENRLLREEREVLKEATQFFAERGKSGSGSSLVWIAALIFGVFVAWL